MVESVRALVYLVLDRCLAAGLSPRNARHKNKIKKRVKGSLPSFVIACTAAYPLRRIIA
jgi:hypothetical protein